MSFHEWLGGLLVRKHEDGTRKFSQREIEDLVGAVVLSTGFAPGSLPPRVARALQGLIDRAALDPTEDLAARGRRLDAYFAEHPLPDELLIDFRQSLRAEIGEKGDTGVGSAFLSFLDDADAAAKRARTEGEARPEGTRPGGALGFFLAKGDVGASTPSRTKRPRRRKPR